MYRSSYGFQIACNKTARKNIQLCKYVLILDFGWTRRCLLVLFYIVHNFIQTFHCGNINNLILILNFIVNGTSTWKNYASKKFIVMYVSRVKLCGLRDFLIWFPVRQISIVKSGIYIRFIQNKNNAKKLCLKESKKNSSLIFSISTSQLINCPKSAS